MVQFKEILELSGGSSSSLKMRLVTEEQTEAICKKAVSCEGRLLQYVKNQTEAIVKKALDNDVTAFEFVEKQTEQMALDAVKRRGDLLRFVHVQTEAVCVAAIKDFGRGIPHVRDWSIVKNIPSFVGVEGILRGVELPDEILIKLLPSIPEEIPYRELTDSMEFSLILQKPKLLEYMESPSGPTVIAAVSRDGNTLRWVSNPSPLVVTAAVMNKGEALRWVKNQNEDIVYAAVSQDGKALEYAKVQTPKICKRAIEENALALQYVREPTYELCEVAVALTGYSIAYVPSDLVDEKLCKLAIETTPKAFRLMQEHQTPELARWAVERYPTLIDYVSLDMFPDEIYVRNSQYADKV